MTGQTHTARHSRKVAALSVAALLALSTNGVWFTGRERARVVSLPSPTATGADFGVVRLELGAGTPDRRALVSRILHFDEVYWQSVDEDVPQPRQGARTREERAPARRVEASSLPRALHRPTRHDPRDGGVVEGRTRQLLGDGGLERICPGDGTCTPPAQRFQ